MSYTRLSSAPIHAECVQLTVCFLSLRAPTGVYRLSRLATSAGWPLAASARSSGLLDPARGNGGAYSVSGERGRGTAT